MVVTQEVDDIISSPIVKEAIINNSDCKILLDQRKYMNKFEHIQRLLGLTEKEKGQILSINQANHPGRFYREVWIGLGGTCSAVYATEVSEEEYFTFTTEESEKLEVQRIAGGPEGSLEGAIRRLAEKSERNRNRYQTRNENDYEKQTPYEAGGMSDKHGRHDIAELFGKRYRPRQDLRNVDQRGRQT